MYLNKAIIVGNITKDPEIKALPSGMKVCSFGVATNRVWKDANGAKQEAADFHNIIVFGKQAESTAQYMSKGNQIMIEGRIQTRSWDKDGVKMYRTEIVAESVQFGNKPNGNENKVVEDKKEIIVDDSPSIDPISGGNSDLIPF
jgi:single-strand DNA-binding protein